MGDYLKTICDKTNINLYYTNNKFKVSSINLNDDIPKLRVHKIFKGCPMNVADAIISYYMKFDSPDENYKIIEAYVKTNFPSNKYIIEHPNNKLKMDFIDSIRPSVNKTNSIVNELNIASISEVDSQGNISKLNADKTMRVNGGEVMDLTITVSPVD